MSDQDTDAIAVWAPPEDAQPLDLDGLCVFFGEVLARLAMERATMAEPQPKEPHERREAA